MNGNDFPTQTSPVIPQDTEKFHAHMALVEERYKLQGEDFEGVVQEKLEFLRSSKSLNAERRGSFIHQAFTSQKNAQKVFWLRKEADYVSAPVRPLSACSSGCSHCCNIGVMVSEAEAKVISKEIGVPIVTPTSDKLISVEKSMDSKEAAAELIEAGREKSMNYFGRPCTFLRAGKCSIYASRPLACRQLFNMDSDDLLCQLVEGAQIRVPYLNQQQSQLAYLLLWGRHSKLADLREWFPASNL